MVMASSSVSMLSATRSTHPLGQVGGGLEQQPQLRAEPLVGLSELGIQLGLGEVVEPVGPVGAHALTSRPLACNVRRARRSRVFTVGREISSVSAISS